MNSSPFEQFAAPTVKLELNARPAPPARNPFEQARWREHLKKYKYSIGSGVVVLILLYFLACVARETSHEDSANTPVAVAVGGEQSVAAQRCGLLNEAQLILSVRRRLMPTASADLRALALAHGYLEISDGTYTQGDVGFLPLTDIRTVSFIDGKNTSSSEPEDCSQLILEYDCVRLTFNITQYDQVVEHRNRYQETQLLSRELFVIRSFKVDLREFMPDGGSQFRKLTKLSPVWLTFKRSMGFACLRPMTFIGKDLRLDHSRDQVIEREVAKLRLSQFKLELDGEMEYTYNRLFKKNRDPESCDTSNPAGWSL